MPFLDAIRLALSQIRVQKLKSFFTLLGVVIGVMFLIAVVSIVEGMSSYMEHDFVGKLVGVNTISLRRNPGSAATSVKPSGAMQRSSRILITDVEPVVAALLQGRCIRQRDTITSPCLRNGESRQCSRHGQSKVTTSRSAS